MTAKYVLIVHHDFNSFLYIYDESFSIILSGSFMINKT